LSNYTGVTLNLTYSAERSRSARKIGLPWIQVPQKVFDGGDQVSIGQ
jgi:hypothetical protein